MKHRPFLLLTLLLLPQYLSAQEKDSLVVRGMQEVSVVHTAEASLPTLYRPYRTISGGDIRKGKDNVSKAALSRNTEEYAVGEINGCKGRFDLGFLDLSGKPVFLEIKTGPRAGFTYNQKVYYSFYFLRHDNHTNSKRANHPGRD